MNLKLNLRPVINMSDEEIIAKYIEMLEEYDAPYFEFFYKMEEFDRVAKLHFARFTPKELVCLILFDYEDFNFAHPYFGYDRTGNLRSMTTEEVMEEVMDNLNYYCNAESLKYHGFSVIEEGERQ